MSGKFDCARDEALSVMASEGWANRTDGNVESPTGWFALICNDASDVAEICAAFEKEFESIEGLTTKSLVGNFILEESEIGFVYVTGFATQWEAEKAFDVQAEIHAEWENN